MTPKNYTFTVLYFEVQRKSARDRDSEYLLYREGTLLQGLESLLQILFRDFGVYSMEKHGVNRIRSLMVTKRTS
jgi:hypothetical protein